MNERGKLYAVQFAETIARIRRYPANRCTSFIAVAISKLARDIISVWRYNVVTTSPAVSTLGAGALRSPLFICAAR